ncbi:MAG: flagellar export chaperone FliS [Bryobacteraceae bacterium]
MRPTAYRNYFEDEILSADPVKLVQLLYRGALNAIGSARRYLAAGDIQARSRAVTKAINILTELVQSLDHARGGELSQNLLRVYDYSQRLLIEGNGRQADAPLAEAERLLSTLLEAWQQTQTSHAAEYEPMSCAC